MSFSFGAKPAGTPAFSFGTPTPSTSNASQTSNPPAFSFGTPAASQAQPAASTPSFGFGTPAAQPAASASPFSFGTPAATPASSAPSFSFGASTAPAASSTTSFSFGKAQQPQTSVLSGSLFQSPAPLATPAPPQPTLSQSVLGGPQAEPSIQDKLRAVQLAWDPSSPHCQFMYYVYNVMDPQRAQWVQQNGHQRQHHDVNEALWLKAIRENPDPARLAPYLIVGLDNLVKRASQQQEFAQKQQAKLDEIAAQLKQLSSQYSLQTSLRIQKAIHGQSVLSARLMSIVARIHALTPQRSAPLRPEEEELKTQVDALASDFTGKRPTEAAYLLEDPASGVSSGRLPNKVNELWVAMAQKKSKQMLAQSKDEWAVANEQELGKVLEVLAQQQRTLDYLSQTLTFDLQVLDVIKKGFAMDRLDGEADRKTQRPDTPTSRR